jgi:hypothetical protein
MAARKSPAETAIAKFTESVQTTKLAADTLSPVQRAVRALEEAAQAKLTAVKALYSAEVAIMAARDNQWEAKEAYIDAMSDLDEALMSEIESSERLSIRSY